MLNAAVSKKIPDDLIRYGQSQIQTLLNTVTSVDFVMLCSSDGFEIALSSKKQIANGSQLAAVRSSLLAMVSDFISELKIAQGFTTSIYNKPASHDSTALTRPLPTK